MKSAAIITTILVLCGVLGGPALGFELKLPGAAALTHETEPVASDVNIATGPWAGGVLSHVTVSGQLTRQSWRLGSAGLSTLQILTPLTEQLADAGYTPLFRCDQDQCGGFDFRFAQQGLPEPYMHVDLGDFRYFAAQKMTDEGGDTVTLMVSRSPSAGFVELTRVAPASADEIETTTITSTMTAPVHIGEDSADLIAALEANGHAKLAGLNFPSGSSELDAGPIAALETLAIWLADNPGMTIALVGHTDAVGALDGNIRLSKRRAASVRDRLVEAHGIAANRIEAEGVGYLAPIASNQSDETRGLNRRVEVVITATP